jgi:hypothetical protein
VNRYRYRPDPSHRAQVWAMAVCAVLGGPKVRTVEQAAAIADEVVAKLDQRASAGSFDVDEEPR